MGVGGQRHTPAALPPGKKPGTHCIGGWVSTRVVLDWCGKSRPPIGIRSPDRPARSESIYRLSYPGPGPHPFVYFHHSEVCLVMILSEILKKYNTGCPTRYRTRHFFNNSNTNEVIATKSEEEYVLFFHISYTMR